MAKNMITSKRRGAPNTPPYWLQQGSTLSSQKGFSMVEMLVAAFILAVGILGLAMLQAMSLRASRGSGNLGTAVRIAERVMNQIELEGRLSWLNVTDENLVNPTLADLASFGLKYINPGANGEEETYNPKGEGPLPLDGNSTTDPTDAIGFFKVTITRLVETDAPPVGLVGNMSEFQVQVKFEDSTDSNNKPVPRTFTLTRRIIHG